MNRIIRRIISTLTALSVFSAVSITGTAEDVSEYTGGLCPHHTEHTAECGYAEASEGADCGHEHTEDCYIITENCVHICDESCTDPCTHVCTEESGCITKTLNCSHVHDELCGYKEETAGSPCNYYCEICADNGIDMLSLESDKTIIYNNIEFTEWTETESLPTTEGNWYLADNVMLSEKCTIKPGGTINLYLNGKSVTCTNGYIEIDTGRYYNPGSVYVPTILNLYDNGSGSIIGGESEDQTIKVCGWNAGEVRCSLNVYGGKICGSKRAVDNRGILTVKGGTLEGSLYGIDNPAIASECIIEGGAINGTKYYGIYNYIGDVKISGGEISGTKVGVLNQDGNVTVSGDAIIKGTGSDGVGIMNDYYLYGGDNLPQYLEVNGGIISGTAAGVQNKVKDGHITLNGGTVCGRKGVELFSGEEDEEHFSNSNGIEIDSENYTIGPDRSITVTGDSEVKRGSSDVELPQGGTISPDGTISGKEIVLLNGEDEGITFEGTETDNVQITTDGNVKIPPEGKFQKGEAEITLPDGGTVDNKGNIIAEEIKVEDVTVTGEFTVDSDGNITVLAGGGGTIKKGGTEITLPSGGKVNTDGTIETKEAVIGGTTVSNENNIEFNTDGSIKVSEKDTVQIGDIYVELPKGGTVNADGTISTDEVIVKDITVTGKSVTVDKDGNITVPENGIVKKGETEIILPSGGTVNKDGNIITKKAVAGNTTVTSENEIVFDKDGNIKVSEDDSVQVGDIDVELPKGGTVNADGMISAVEVTVKDVTVKGESVTVDKEGNIIVPENGTIKKGETEITLPSGGKVDTDGTIETKKAVIGGTTVSNENNIEFNTDGSIKVSEKDTVQIGDIYVELPKGGTVNADGTISTDEVIVKDITVTGKSVTIDKDGKIKISEGDTVRIGDDTTITGSGITVSPDGKIILPSDGEVTIERDGKKTIYDAGSLKNGDGTVLIESAEGSEIKYIFADDKSDCPSDGYIFLSVEEDTSDISEAGTISGYTAIKAYDIKLMYNGEKEVQPDGTVKVTLKIPEDADSNTELEVFHISGGAPESMNAVKDDGTISFTTDHFSIYVIASKDSEPSQQSENTVPVPRHGIGLEPAVIGKSDSGTEDASSAAGIVSGNDELGAVKNYSGSAALVCCIFAAVSAAAILGKKKR